MVNDGIIRHAGLSEVTVADIEAASKLFPVATVQNRYNLVNHDSKAVLDCCLANGVGFIFWFPLGAGDLVRPGSVLDDIAGKHGVGPGQTVPAWTLIRSPVMLPIPGTSKLAHLEQNVIGADTILSEAEFAALDQTGRAA